MTKAGPLAAYKARVKRGQITSDPVQEEAARWLQALHDALLHYRPGKRSGLFRRSPAPRGLYLCGDVGRGKSMLMDIFYDTASFDPKGRVHFHAFMQEVHEAIKEWRDMDDGEKRARQRALKIKGNSDDPLAVVAKTVSQRAMVLCFDEFQVEDVADAMILGRLFEALFENGVVVVATSNRPPHELYLDGLNRQLFLPFIALMQSKMDIYQLDAATDYRVGRVQGMEVYFTPLDEAADRKMDQCWATITGTAEAGPCDIKVKGRNLRFKACAAGAMRDDFDALCGQALGPADYLAIARHFHTVFVDHIPMLPKSKRNEAKRFVTLIDTLYEHKVKLVASAEGAPDQLYPAGAGSVEFARAASRLIEMQAQDYLAQEHKD